MSFSFSLAVILEGEAMKVAGYSDVMVEFLAGFFVFISCFISAICSRSVASVVRRSSLACEREEEWPDLEWISVGEVGLVKGLDFAFFILYLCYERHWRSLVRCHGDMPPPPLPPHQCLTIKNIIQNISITR